MAIKTIIETNIKIDATAVMVGLSSKRMPSHIFFGSVMAPTPLINMAMIRSSKELKKANRAPENIPGLMAMLKVMASKNVLLKL